MVATAYERVVVLGAGCIGCWVGGRLALADSKTHVRNPKNLSFHMGGRNAPCTMMSDMRSHPHKRVTQVTFVVRPGSAGGEALRRELTTRGLTLVDKAGGRAHTLPPSRCHVTDCPTAALANAQLVLVATKRTACATLIDAVRAIAPSTPVVLLQNGVHAAKELAEVRVIVHRNPNTVPHTSGAAHLFTAPLALPATAAVVQPMRRLQVDCCIRAQPLRTLGSGAVLRVASHVRIHLRRCFGGRRRLPPAHTRTCAPLVARCS